ncbi:MAG: hypothetical protein GTN83_09540 [Acidobacteria bacterium]|nr:hypothetical protein [Acidobacteriota bacterium]
MDTFRQCVFLLAAQIIVAAALTGTYAMAWVRRRGSRRERATWFRAARAMLRLTPAAVALFLGGAAWILWSDLALPDFGLVWWVAATTPLTVGTRWMLRAGELQSRARVVPCRLLARQAGFFSAAGALLGLGALFTVPTIDPAVWFRPVIAVLLLLIGLSSLLGGLSGKPRPAGAIGTFLWLSGWVVVIDATLP